LHRNGRASIVAVAEVEWECRMKSSDNSGPYLAAEAPQLRAVHHMTDCYTEVTVYGAWSPQLRTRAAQLLRACLAGRPRAVVIDLSDLSDPDGLSESTWRTATRYAATREPGVPVLLCAAPEPVRRRLRNGGSTTRVTLLDGTSDVPAALMTVPLPPSALLPLPADLMSACTGRTAVGDACVRWGVPGLAHRARLVSSELITNAVQHARAEPVLQVSLRAGIMYVGVQDSSPILPELLSIHPYRQGHPAETPGTGLRMVGATATAWGALPCDAGKVVWATLAAAGRSEREQAGSACPPCT
jgi:hypothetical protein